MSLNAALMILPPSPNAGSSTPGLISLAGDLAGDGSIATSPRVGTLTGVSGVVAVRDGGALAFIADETVADVATTGDLRFRSGRTIAAFLNVNGNNAKLISVDTTNNITIGETGGTANVSGVYFQTASSGIVAASINGTLRLRVVNTDVQIRGVPIVFQNASGAANVAATGDIRCQHGTSILVARNSDNTADISIISTSGGYSVWGSTSTNAGSYFYAQTFLQWAIGANTIFTAISNTLRVDCDAVVLGAGTVASTGSIRAANGSAIVVARNADNSADVPVIAVNSSNNVLIGVNIASTLFASNVVMDASSSVTSRVNGVTRLSLTAADATLRGIPLIFQVTAGNGNVALTGSIRAANATTIVAARNAANGADIAVIVTNSSNNLYIGSTDAAGSQATNTYVAGSTSVGIVVGSTNRVSVAANRMQVMTGGTTTATAGDIAFGTATARTILAADAAVGAADIAIVALDASDNVYIGTTAAGADLAAGVMIAGAAKNVGFFGVAPVARASAYTQTYATAAKTVTQDADLSGAAPFQTANPTGTSQGIAFANEAAWDAFMALLDKLVADSMVTKKVVNAIIDDLQAYGLMQ